MSRTGRSLSDGETLPRFLHRGGDTVCAVTVEGYRYFIAEGYSPKPPHVEKERRWVESTPNQREALRWAVEEARQLLDGLELQTAEARAFEEAFWRAFRVSNDIEPAHSVMGALEELTTTQAALMASLAVSDE